MAAPWQQPPPGFREDIEKAKGGDRAAMDRVLDGLRPYLERVSRKYADPTRPVASTSDLLQECCLRAWRRIDTFRGGPDDEQTRAMFRAWLAQIVKNVGLDGKRSRESKRRGPPGKLYRFGLSRGGDPGSSADPVEPVSRDPSPSAQVRSEEAGRSLDAALAEIADSKDAEIVRLYVVEGLTFQGIADRLDVGFGYVWKHYWATVRKLRKQLGTWP